MSNCQSIDPLVTPFVDGQLTVADHETVADHLRACAPCRSRVTAERAVRDLIETRRSSLVAACAPGSSLRTKCTEAARLRPQMPDAHVMLAARSWRSRLAPLAVAASLVLVVGAAFLYQLTTSSSRVMAAELAADHMKCFALNGVLHPHEDPITVESSMFSAFGWRMRLPEAAPEAGLELVGARPCMYGAGKVAHIMYRHNGEPVSLFMLPRTARTDDVVQVLGHQAVIWCANDRTFVLLARERRDEVERMAALVRTSLR